MFNNLIESSSHRREFKRRGSFFLFTTATYALLLIVAGVASIYAYDARLNETSTEIVTLLSPNDFTVAKTPTAEHRASSPSRSNSNSPPVYQRKTLQAAVDQPIVPKGISTKANVVLPMPGDGIVKFGTTDSDPFAGGPGNSGGGSGTQSPNSRPVVAQIETPPAPPVVKPVPKIVRRDVINSQAISLPKPLYPTLAKQSGIQGLVKVQVLIDENGKVISAKVVDGHPFLAPAAQRAAYEARFSPTMLGNQPVKVSGLITYNFVLQ